MGTRAVIRYNGKFLCATHWDGYPESLGYDLLTTHPKNINSIIKVASTHNIDTIVKDYAPQKPIMTEEKKDNKIVIQETRFVPEEKLSGVGTAFEEKGKDIKLAGIITNESQYGDWAEYIYDIRGNNVYVAEGHGDYDATKQAEKAGKLNFGRYVGGDTKKGIVPLTKGEKGWFSESARHSLARKGIKTGRKKK